MTPDVGARRRPVVPPPVTHPVAESRGGWALGRVLHRRPGGEGRLVAWVTAGAVAVLLLVWIALMPLPPRGVAADTHWFTFEGPGFRVDLPAAPIPEPSDAGGSRVTTALSGGRAYTVVWFPLVDPRDQKAAVTASLQALGRAPATITANHPGMTGPFASTDLTARLSDAFFHGRLLVVGHRGYLVGEVGTGAAAPSDLEHLLAGFDPSPSGG